MLTINGKAKLVIQDADVYQTILDEFERNIFLEGIRQGLNESEQGQG